MIKRFLFPSNVTTNTVSLGLLIMRIVFGGMLMLNHGWAKMMNFSDMAPSFTGGSLGLGLAVFAEFFCAAGVVFGVLYRLALIPLIVTMCVAFFGAHGAALTGPGSGEMALLYLAVFAGLFIIGPDKFTADKAIFSKA